MRKFNLVILNESDLIIERYPLTYVTNIGGLGYDLALSTIETDIKDYVTKIIQKKKNISLTLIHTDKYNGKVNLTNWIQANSNKTMCLEYINGVETLYCEGMVINSDFDELNEYRVLNHSIVFKPLTPFFKRFENKIIIQKSETGKFYPFSYPYTYGYNTIVNNEINNTYFSEVPIIVSVYGTITNPHISLTDSSGNIYNEIVFDNLFIDEGQRIIINSAQKKIWFDDGSGNLVDYYSYLDDAYDSYLRAKPNDISKIEVNLDGINDTGYLIGSWRQYTL